ncbi:MAG: DEAD/DEAH box helicase, partial [Deltaproteobacteria bacterium]|nr:DEAD/DEAH box helicase [Deltaproteobacteria bacterium]
MNEKRSRNPRPRGGFYRKKMIRQKEKSNVRYRLDPLLKDKFSRIGVPEITPFKPDTFQLEALEKIKRHDVLVSAPTGAGKTWIASRAIERCLKKGLRVWYASPLKALSNSLYQDFSQEFGGDCVGILTGERKENSSAPVIVGTTEILRNQLYDSMHEGRSINTDLVILDEAHYLGDPDRGVVWEEVLIYLPPRVRLLLLSATISNAEEVCLWLENNRKSEIEIVRSFKRPVPLEMIFLFPDGLIAPLSGSNGITSRVRKYIALEEGKVKRRGRGRIIYGDIIRILRKFDLLPAIFFLKSRKECDSAVSSCHLDVSKTRKEKMKREVSDFLDEYPHLKGHRHLESLTGSMVASHHAGQLPFWKILVERLMNRGLLDAIFSTSTVAAGVNFPARTVVLLQSDRYNGHEFADLTATDLHQMTGRAGRRGKDNIGFILIIPGLHQDPNLIHKLRDSPPEPILSRIHVNFSMTLNLLLSHSPSEVKDLLDLSFANFQMKSKESLSQALWTDKLEHVKHLLPKARCDTDDPYEIIDNIRIRSGLLKESESFAGKSRDESLQRVLEPGRVFQCEGKGIFVLFRTYRVRGKLVCVAHDLKKPVRFRKGKIKLRRISSEKIRMIYDYLAKISEDSSMGELQALFDSIDTNNLRSVDIENQMTAEAPFYGKRVNEIYEKGPCNNCFHFRECHGRKGKELKKILNDLSSFLREIESVEEGLWISFRRHVRFLRNTGFVDESGRLTPDGVWASKLRLDQPLLIAEAIRRKGFDDLSPAALAGCIALFVWDRDLDVEIKIGKQPEFDQIFRAIKTLSESIERIRQQKDIMGFDNPPILVWPAVALFLWARMVSWEQLMF